MCPGSRAGAREEGPQSGSPLEGDVCELSSLSLGIPVGDLTGPGPRGGACGGGAEGRLRTDFKFPSSPPRAPPGAGGRALSGCGGGALRAGAGRMPGRGYKWTQHRPLPTLYFCRVRPALLPRSSCPPGRSPRGRSERPRPTPPARWQADDEGAAAPGRQRGG